VRAYFVVQANLLRAHAAAYWAIHAVQASARVGLAHNVLLFDPLDPCNTLDCLAATGQDASFNGFVLEALAHGQAPPVCRLVVGDLSVVHDTFDYLGLNYYTRHIVAFDLRNPRDLFSRHLTLPATERMEPVATLAAGEIYPEGLHRVLRRLSIYGKPIYITENGFADGMDALRPRALVRTLAALHVAIAEGAPVRGYFHWTLVDNFEWAEGWSLHFGLYRLDRATQKRFPRPSAEVYSRIARANAVPTELLMRFSAPASAAEDGQLALSMTHH
jgi:beta-glucosidase